MPPDPAAVMVEEEVIAAERDAALRAAFAELPGGCHQLLSMLVSDPPCSYAEISSTLQHAGGQHRPDARPLPGAAAPLAAPGGRPRTAGLGRTGPGHGRKQEVSTVAESWNDEALLAALRQALAARQAVPPEFVEAGKSAFAWHNIDAELAQLTYDSARDTEPRGGHAGPRPRPSARSPSPRPT